MIDFVTTLARILTRHGNRVGALLYGQQLDLTIPARGGRDQVLRLTNALLEAPRLPRATFTDLSPLLEAGLKSIKRRSLVVIVSDFISAPGWERRLGLLARRHEVLAIRVWDPREVKLPDIGPLIMEDAETGEQLYVDTTTRASDGASEAGARSREAGDRRRRSGGPASRRSPLSTDDDLVRAIVRMATLRRRRRDQRRCPSSGR